MNELHLPVEESKANLEELNQSYISILNSSQIIANSPLMSSKLHKSNSKISNNKVYKEDLNQDSILNSDNFNR